MWSCSLYEVSYRGRDGEMDFFLHFLHNFLSISSLKTLVCKMCRVCFPWIGGCRTCQNKKKEKKREGDRKKRREREENRVSERERCFCIAIEKDGVITQKTSPPCFFTFLSWSSRNTELLLRPEYLDRTPVTHADIEREEKTNAPQSRVQRPLFLYGITPNWCSCETANGRLGTEGRLWVQILEQ